MLQASSCWQLGGLPLGGCRIRVDRVGPSLSGWEVHTGRLHGNRADPTELRDGGDFLGSAELRATSSHSTSAG